MSEKESIELSTRGKKQLKDVLYNEVKTYVDTIMQPMIEKRIDYILKNKVEELGHSILKEKLEKVIRDIHRDIIEKMLRASNFQEKLKEEIIKYIHERSACGQLPFEEQLNSALKRALKELIQ